MLIIVRLIAVILFILLWIYFFYTVVTIFIGSTFIPTSKSRLRKIKDLAEIKGGEVILDLGSGDGRILFALAEEGAGRCIGLEINPFVCLLSIILNYIKGLNSKVKIYRKDFWSYNLSEIDILTLYLEPRHYIRLQKKIKKEMKPGSRIIVTVYPLRDWEPTTKSGNVFLYTV